VELPLILPFPNVEKEEEREECIYTIFFVEGLESLAIIPANPSPGKRKKPGRKDKGKKFVGVE